MSCLLFKHFCPLVHIGVKLPISVPLILLSFVFHCHVFCHTFHLHYLYIQFQVATSECCIAAESLVSAVCKCSVCRLLTSIFSNFDILNFRGF
jgi:hypothetical protein